MPAALNVNREAVQALAVSIGVRAAARELGINESTVQQWSKRENWFPTVKTVHPPTVIERVTSVTKSPVDAMRDVGERSRFALALAGEKAAKHLERMAGHEIVNKSTKFKDIVGATSQLHGWDAKDAAGSFSLNVLSLGDLNVKIGNNDNA
jgi:DNA-binding transcriptional regulator YdaS (Cro superfamily)